MVKEEVGWVKKGLKRRARAGVRVGKKRAKNSKKRERRLLRKYWPEGFGKNPRNIAKYINHST